MYLSDFLDPVKQVPLALLEGAHVAAGGAADLGGDGLRAQFDPLGHLGSHLHALFDGAHSGLGVGQ